MSDTTIKGFVEHITYRSEETGYTVLTLCADGEEVTAVGVLPEIGEGETIQCEGSFQVHATYGRQFRIREFSLSVPEDEASMERYLSSGLIKGIGKALAHRIVKRFGTETFDIIEKEPDRLAEVNGISEKKAREIYLQVCEKKDQRDGVLFLSRYGISNTLALRIWKAYGSEVYRIIRENPYLGWQSIPGSASGAASSIRFSLPPEKEVFTCPRRCCFGGHPVCCPCRFQVSFRRPRCSLNSHRLPYSRGYRRLPYILGFCRRLCSQRFRRRASSREQPASQSPTARGQFASLSPTAWMQPIHLSSGMRVQPGQMGKRDRMYEIRTVCLMRTSSLVCIRRGRRAEKKSGKKRNIWSFWRTASGIFPPTER